MTRTFERVTPNICTFVPAIWALSRCSCRTASVPYIDGCWANPFVHLTNHSVQVLLLLLLLMLLPLLLLLMLLVLLTLSQLSSESFGQHEEGNELSCAVLPSTTFADRFFVFTLLFCDILTGTSSWHRTWSNMRLPAPFPPL
jgi:hypothetical protein